MFLPHPRVKLSIVGSLCDREVECSTSNRQGTNFESCVWRTVSSHSSHHPQEVLLAQFSVYVHKGGQKPDSFYFLAFTEAPLPPRYLRQENTRIWANAGLMLCQRRRRLTNIDPALVKRLMFASDPAIVMCKGVQINIIT